MAQSKMRKEMIDDFLNALQEDKIPWHKSWSALQSMPPRNAVKGTEYRGVNRFWLFHTAEQKGYSDPRWCTFKQAKDNDWHVKKGEKGTHVEFWSLYDRETKKTINDKEADSLRQQLSPEEYAERVKPVANNYTVFNAEQIEGIPKLPELAVETYELDEDEIIRTRAVLLENMSVLFQEGGEKAFYRPSEDCIHLPEIRRFESEYDYMATLLHEAGHATGHESRLRRPILNVFGTPDYAKEELRAEIASAFTTQTLHLSQSGSHMDNHKAYIQSWIKILKNEPDELFRAIREAEKISDYLIEKGEFTLERSEEKEITLQKEKSFSEQVDDVLSGRANRYDDLKVCDTPQILLDAGCEQLPMLYTKAHLRKALLPKDAKKHNHGLDVEQIKRLPEYMQEPVMLIDSSTREDSIIVVLSVLDNEKSPLVVTVRPNGKGTYDLEVQDSNFITSVYGRDNFEQFLNLSLENDMVLYWNKSKSQELFSVLGLQFPKGFNNLDYDNIIHQSNNIVKKNQAELLEIENGWESGKEVPGRPATDQEKLVDEVARLEETLYIPHEKRITEWFGDYAINIAKHGVTEDDLQKRREELYVLRTEPTVAEHAASSYEPYSGIHGEEREYLFNELAQLEKDTFVPMEERFSSTLQKVTEKELNERISFLKQYRIPLMSFQKMAKLRMDVKRELPDNFDYYTSLSASEKDILGVLEWIELYRKQGISDEEIILSHLDEIHSRCGHDSYDYTKNLVCSACSRDRGEYYERISLADSMEHERQMQKQVSSLSEELDQIERQRINERSIENGKTR